MYKKAFANWMEVCIVDEEQDTEDENDKNQDQDNEDSENDNYNKDDLKGLESEDIRYHGPMDFNDGIYGEYDLFQPHHQSKENYPSNKKRFNVSNLPHQSSQNVLDTTMYNTTKQFGNCKFITPETHQIFDFQSNTSMDVNNPWKTNIWIQNSTSSLTKFMGHEWSTQGERILETNFKNEEIWKSANDENDFGWINDCAAK